MCDKNPIIVIDDEKDTLDSIELTLQVAGYDPIMTFTSWEQAKDSIDTEKPSLIILDILMKGTSGIDALKMIKSKHPKLNVIMSTGIREIDVVVQCMKYGASDYLVKPLIPETFLEKVEFLYTHTSSDQNKITERGMEIIQELSRSFSIDEIVICKDTLEPKENTHFLNLRTAFDSNLVFRNADLTISSLASIVQTNRSYLAAFIRKAFACDFRTFVNCYRIAYFMRLYADPKSKNLTTDYLASQIGFSRRATFYENFIRFTGQTPSQWIKINSL
jgi:DNA-binding response OmpR family regulator